MDVASKWSYSGNLHFVEAVVQLEIKGNSLGYENVAKLAYRGSSALQYSIVSYGIVK